MNRLVDVSTLIVNVAILSLLVVLYLEVRPAPVSITETIIEVPVEDTSATEDSSAKDDMDIAREELVAKWSEIGLTDVNQVIATGDSVLSDEQASIEQLEEVAKKANAAANFVGFIQEEYGKYYRENYKYDFVQKVVAGPHDAFVEISNNLKAIRNKAFLRIGDLHYSDGRIGEAFFYYRDAFRLATFDAYSKDDPGVRFLAEQKMKDMLGLADIESYKTWR